MSQQQICTITLAALSVWSASNSKESFNSWLFAMKNSGFFWGADETLEDAPNA